MTLPATRAFDHVLIVMFENQYRGYVMRNPYMRGLARQGIDLTGFCGVMHPSQTNYIASIAGELCNVTGDDPVSPLLSQRTIVDLIEEAPGGLTWKAYMESYVCEAQPWTPDLAPGDMPPYYVKHNPFGSFSSIVRDEARWRRVESEAALFSDLLNGTFPEYAWFSPNMWSDGHWINGTQDESDPRAPALVDQAARWLMGFFERLRFPGPRSHLPPRTLVVVLFDEADYESEWDPAAASTYDGPNQIYCVLLGDMIRPGVQAEVFNHYSLLRTIEVNFGLGSLGKNDAGANWFQFLWGRKYHWGAPSATPIHAAEALAAAAFAGALHVVYTGRDGSLRARSLSHNGWSDDAPVGGSASAVALAAAHDRLVLVSSGAGGLYYQERALDHGWTSPAEPLVSGPTGAFALASMPGGEGAMLVWRDASGALQSRLYRRGEWGPVAPAGGFSSSGALALSSLGASLYLIFEAPGTGQLAMVSYNTAPFNVVTPPGSPQDNTTMAEWSPSAFPVAHYSARPDSRTPGEPEPSAQALAARGPLVAATLDGVLHLAYGAAKSRDLLTATFSAAGLMTPARPVSTASAAAATHSNGYGTAAEAGWDGPAQLHGMSCPQGAALAMAAWDSAVALLFQPEAGGPVRLALGRHEHRSS